MSMQILQKKKFIEKQNWQSHYIINAVTQKTVQTKNENTQKKKSNFRYKKLY